MSRFENRIVAVINKSIPVGNAMNCLGHISIALGGVVGADDLHLVDYIDADQACYPGISKMPFVILRATGGKIRTLKAAAEEKGIAFRCFTDTMTIGTWEEQVAGTAEKGTDDLTFWGIVMHGPSATLTEMTRKFSLYS